MSGMRAQTAMRRMQAVATALHVEKKKVWRHNHQGQQLKCPTCVATETQLPCDGCQKLFPQSTWSEDQRKNRSRNKNPLHCPRCRTKNEEDRKQTKLLQAKFKRSQVYCKCDHLFGHAEKCPLHRVLYNAPTRYPGCDGHISLEENEWLNELKEKPKWWRKACRKAEG